MDGGILMAIDGNVQPTERFFGFAEPCVAAARYLKTRDDVDPKRVGIWGLSYVGVLTAQALARN